MSLEPPAADRVGQLLAWLDLPGPRYTAYPTADGFDREFRAADLCQALERRAAQGAGASALAVELHWPSLDPACVAGDFADPGLRALEQEIALHTGVLGAGQPLSRFHLSGGSPTLPRDPELVRLMALLRGAFRFTPQAEISVDVDAETVDGTRLRPLAALGFNRLKAGVSGLEADTQSPIRGAQTVDALQVLLDEARAAGFESVEVGLVYGLPRQTPESFARTVAQLGGLRPDRITLQAPARLAQHLEPQRRVHAHEVPGAGDRVHMLRAGLSGLQGQGYVHIGMDHFALPTDPLALARREDRLRRNTQGYATQTDGDLLGLGPSAISRVGGCCSQNVQALCDYEAALQRGQFPVERGLVVGAEDQLRRTVIMALLCQGQVLFDAVEQAHGIRFGVHFREELERLRPFAARLLVELTPGAIRVTPLGWYFVRAIATVFDRHRQVGVARERHPRML